MRRAALALVALNLVLGIAVRFEPPWLVPSLSASPDLAALVLLLLAAPGFFGRLGRPGRFLLAGALSLLLAARLAERIAVELLGRPLDPVGDLPNVGAVASMLGAAFPAPVLVLMVAGFGGLAAALLFLGERAIRALVRAAGEASPRLRVVGALLALAAFLPLLGPPGGSGMAAVVRIALAPLRDLPAPLTDPELPPAPELGGADVLLVFVESYGVVAWEREELRSRLAPAAERLAADATAGGFEFLSAQIQSPTFGGGSWRAHASLLSGVRVDSEARYRSLVRSDRASLARRFAAAGYRTVAYEPGISGAWPEGEWYGFERSYDRPEIGYRGPRIGWWEVPDQYTLYALHRQELASATRPVFAKVSLITSHIPYWPIPRYVFPWERFDEGTAYDGPIRSVAHDDYRDLDELADRYVASLAHEFRILGGFLRQFVRRRTFVLIVGDHQPPRLSLHDSDTWATPIHLFSQDPALLEPFRTLGFERTLMPLAGTSWRMSDLSRDWSALFPPRREP